MILDIKDLDIIEPSEDNGGGGGGGGGQPPPPRPENVIPWSDDTDKDKQKGNGTDSDEGDEGDEDQGDTGSESQKGQQGDEKNNKNKEKGNGEDSETGEEQQGNGQGDEGNEGDEEGEGEDESIIYRKDQSLDNHIIDPSDAPEVLEVPDHDKDYTPRQQGNKTDKQIENELEENKDKASRLANEIRKGGEGRSEGGESVTSIFKKRYNPTSIDWRALLEDFLKVQYKKGELPTKPEKIFQSRRIFIPATRKVKPIKTLNTVIGIDTSGSVTPPILNTFISSLSEIITDMPEVKLMILLFTDKVYAQVDVDTRPSAYDYTDNPSPVKGVEYFRATIESKENIKDFLFNSIKYKSGGTVVSSITDHLIKIDENKLSGLLVFTDGDCEQNINMPDVEKVIFFINKGGKTSIAEKYGTVIKIDVEHSGSEF